MFIDELRERVPVGGGINFIRSLDEADGEQHCGGNVKNHRLGSASFHGRKFLSWLQSNLTSSGALIQVDFLLYLRKFPLLAPLPLLCGLVVHPLEGGWRPELGQPKMWQLPDDGGGTSGYTYNVVWDAQGRAYLGKERLWRWDGGEWQVLGPDNFEFVVGMDFDDKGMLWLGGMNQFGVLDPRDGSYQSRLDWIPDEHRDFGEVWIIRYNSEGLWMGTHNRLFRFRDGEVKVWKFAGLHRVIFHFVDDIVFAHEAEVGLWKIQDGKQSLVNEDHKLIRKSIQYMDSLPNGDYLGLSDQGLFFLKSENFKVFDHLQIKGFADKMLSSVVRIEDYFFVGTLSSGLFIIDQNANIIDQLEIGSKGDKEIILHVGEDSDGKLWVLTDRRAWVSDLKLTLGLIDNFGDSSSGRINGIKIDRFKMGIASDSDFQVFELVNGALPQNVSRSYIRAQHLVSHRGGYLYDRYSRIMWTDGGEVREICESPGEIRSFTVTGRGILWISLSDRLLKYRLDGLGSAALEEEVLTESAYFGMGTDEAGRVWGWSPGAPLLEIVDVEADTGRMTWHEEILGMDLRGESHRFAMTRGGPVLVFDGKLLYGDSSAGTWRLGTFAHGGGMPEAMAFRSDTGGLSGWLVYRDEKLDCTLMKELTWVPGEDPVMRAMPWIDMGILGKITTIEVVEGEPRRFLIGGSGGIVMAEESLASEVPAPSVPVIYRNGDLGRSPASFESEFGEANYRFRFSAADSGLYYPVVFETLLDGRDREWSQVGSESIREIGQLLEGDYTFRVRARDPFGRVSPTASVDILIHPPWYRTGPFYAACFLAFILVVILFARAYAARLRRQKASLERIVNERTAELKKANEFKDDFIANLSHEIRNPLNGVIGLIEQLQPGTDFPDRYISALQGAAHYLQTTVEEVLDFAKLQSGELHADKGLVDLHKVVNGVIEIYNSDAKRKGLELSAEVRIPEGLGILTDAAKVNQIIGNLTGNAVKFTKTGSVHVGVVLKRFGEHNGSLQIRVEDSGPGISESEKGRIFEKFYQSRSRIQKTRGTGLGLALVKRYADCLGGDVELKSEVGKGSVFQVVLPVEIESAIPESGEADSTAQRLLNGMRVLVVEDMEYNRIVLEGQLSGLGCSVDFAEDGLSGVKMATRGDYRVILLDWDLPGLKGLDVARRLRGENLIPPETRIIGMTAYAIADVREQCLAAGMNDFLTKPLSAVQIQRVLAGLVEQRPFIEGRGLLGEMRNGQSWEANLERWAGFFEGYRGELEAAVDNGTPEEVRKAAHRLLGHLGMLEIRDLPDALRDLLTVAHAGDAAGIREEWKTLSVQLAQLGRELKG